MSHRQVDPILSMLEAADDKIMHLRRHLSHVRRRLRARVKLADRSKALHRAAAAAAAAAAATAAAAAATANTSGTVSLLSFSPTSGVIPIRDALNRTTSTGQPQHSQQGKGRNQLDAQSNALYSISRNMGASVSSTDDDLSEGSGSKNTTINGYQGGGTARQSSNESSVGERGGERGGAGGESGNLQHPRTSFEVEENWNIPRFFRTKVLTVEESADLDYAGTETTLDTEFDVTVCKIYLSIFEKLYRADRAIRVLKAVWRFHRYKRIRAREKEEAFLKKQGDQYEKERMTGKTDL
jgi:hypothetical protein